MTETNSNTADLSMFSSKTAFIVGYTGEVGKHLTKELLSKKMFKRVVLLGRRTVDLDKDLVEAANAEQVQIDFDNIDEDKHVFDGTEVGFCCLGTTKGRSGKEGFIKVDHDYVVNTAKAAKESGCKQFHLVTSMGADKNSFFLYPKTKGLAEEHVAELKFPRFSVYRPGQLLTDREESRPGEKIVMLLFKPFNALFPTLTSVPVSTVAKAMIANLWKEQPENGVEIISNSAIHKLGDDYNKLFEAK